MGLADGDLYVSGSILSFQQMKRIYQNFRAATVPSNLQAGALWSRSSDDKLWHQGTTLDEVFTEQTTLTWQNLLSNSGFGVWSQSDAAKGLCTIAYDTGAKGAGSAPSVGDAVVGANGATAKLISYTIASGTWAGGNAAGVLTLGACTGGWTDNEVLTFAGVETAAINGESIGIVNDPCNNDGTGDWTDADSILSFDTDHYEIASDAANEKIYRTSLTFTEGKIYKIEAQLKDGTATPTDVEIVSLNGATVEWASRAINTTAAFVTYLFTFEATANTDGVGIRTPTSLAGNNIEMKYFICYEIRGCATGADTKAADFHSKTSSLDTYQIKDDSTHIEASYYGLQLVKTVATAEYYNLNIITHRKFLDIRKGQTYTVGCYVYDDSGDDDNIKLQIYDGVAIAETAFFTSGAKQWLETTITVDDSATEFTPRILCDGDIGDIAYISPIMLVKGDYIGEGNYQPKQQEWVYFEGQITSNYFHAKTGISNEGGTINIEADSDGKFPKGAKAILIRSVITDSGSAGEVSSARLLCKGSSSMGFGHSNYVAGKANNSFGSQVGPNLCDENGDYVYSIAASGVGTFGIQAFYYVGIQVN